MNRKELTQAEIYKIRSDGDSLIQSGLIEVNLDTKKINWCNKFILSTNTWTTLFILDKLLLEVCPSEFHQIIEEAVKRHISGHSYYFSIWPSVTGANKITWWYCHHKQTSMERNWFHMDLLKETSINGPEFNEMKALMHTTDAYNNLYCRVNKFEILIQKEIERIDSHDLLTTNLNTEMLDRFEHSKAASLKATQMVIDNDAQSKIFQGEIKNEIQSLVEQFDKYKLNIYKLENADNSHDKQFAAYQDYTKKLVEAFNDSMRRNNKSQASRLSRNITIPVGLIVVIIGFIQWFLINFIKK